MSVEQVRNKANNITRNLGKAALHALSPDDFEYYACSFELVDSDFTVLDILHFPVLPNSISIGNQSLVSIKKTGRAYLTQFNDSFVGKNISINGTFGRKFRLLLSGEKKSNALTGVGGAFDLKVKTGYGTLKLLEKLIEQTYQVGNGNPRMLIFNNHAFNQSFIVEVLSFNPTMSVENNMIWNYGIEMKAVADVNKLILTGGSTRRLINLLASDVLGKAANDLFSDFKGVISSKTNMI